MKLVSSGHSWQHKQEMKQRDEGASHAGSAISPDNRTAKTPGVATVPDVKRLCGSGVMGQSELPRGEVGKGGRPAGRGFGCLKLLLSEKSDWDSAAAPSKGERAVRSDTLMGTTRLGLVKPGGGDGESLVGIWGEVAECDGKKKRHCSQSQLAIMSMKRTQRRESCCFMYLF